MSGSDVITAQQFIEAAQRSGRTMQELADLLGVNRSMIYNYRSNGVARPARTVAHVRAKMGLWLREDSGNPLAGYEFEDLLNELGRRFADLSAVIDKSNRAAPEPRPDSPPAPEGTGRYTGTGGPPEQ